MAGRRTDLMELRNLLRHLQASSSISAIQRATGLNRRTIMRYRDWAAAHNLLSEPLPPLEQLQQLLATSLPSSAPPQTISSVEPYRALVEQLYADGVEGSAILQRLKERGYTGTQSSIYRFLHHLDPHRVLPPVRVEREPGTEAQVDFGYAGRMLDPQTGTLRKSWAFVMTLAYSRHQYVEFVFDQTLATWIGLHQHAFSFFGGVPQRVVLDNLKAGISKACWDDPQVQSTYRECAEHYGFLLAPCRPRTPEHKGKVEQGGGNDRQAQFLGRTYADTYHPGQS
jgi:transposase